MVTKHGKCFSESGENTLNDVGCTWLLKSPCIAVPKDKVSF